MKYYKNADGEVYAYETEQERQEWGAPDLVEMALSEVEAHLNPVPTIEQLISHVEAARKVAYADAQTGSDRLFTEAQRMQMMGESGWEAVRDVAIARYNEIKTEHPWPVEETL